MTKKEKKALDNVRIKIAIMQSLSKILNCSFSFENLFDEVAKDLGVKRYSDEYNRFIWVHLNGVPAKIYDNSTIEELIEYVKKRKLN